MTASYDVSYTTLVVPRTQWVTVPEEEVQSPLILNLATTCIFTIKTPKEVRIEVHV